MTNKKEPEQFAEGVVVEALPNALFRVEMVSDNTGRDKDETSGESEDQTTLVYLSGKMRIHRIRVLVGDRVKIKLDSYGGRGRIVQRLK